MSDDSVGKQPPNRSPRGKDKDAAKQARLARQLRANLGKRKQQQRDRSSLDKPEDGDS